MPEFIHKLYITGALCDWAVSFLLFNQPFSTITLPSTYLTPVGIKPLALSAFMPWFTHWNKQHWGSKMPVWKAESERKKRGPSVVLYNTVWPLISADKADGSVTSLAAIPVPNHQWIPTVILSSLLLNIYNRWIFLDHPVIVCLINLWPQNPVSSLIL